MKFPWVLSSPKCLQVIFSFQVVFPLAAWSKGQSSSSFRREQKSLINTFELLVNGSISSFKKKSEKWLTYKSPLRKNHVVCESVCSFAVMLGSVTPWTVGSSVHGVFLARILECVAISYSRGASWPRYQTHISYVSYIDRQILYHSAIYEATYARVVLSYFHKN